MNKGSGSFSEKPSRRQLLDDRFVRFIMVGFSNYVVGFSVFQLTMRVTNDFPFKVSFCQLFSYATGVLWSFFWNRRFTFRSTGSAAPQVIRFISLQAALAVASAVVIGLCVDLLSIPPTPSWFLVMTIVTIVNFLVSKRWVFQ